MLSLQVLGELMLSLNLLGQTLSLAAALLLLAGLRLLLQLLRSSEKKLRSLLRKKLQGEPLSERLKRKREELANLEEKHREQREKEKIQAPGE